MLNSFRQSMAWVRRQQGDVAGARGWLEKAAEAFELEYTVLDGDAGDVPELEALGLTNKQHEEAENTGVGPPSSCAGRNTSITRPLF